MFKLEDTIFRITSSPVKILNKEELETFNSFNNLNLYNHAKVKVGYIRTKIE